MRRFSHLRPGYDCIRTPCGVNGCGTNPGACHGIHGDEWIYVVSDGVVALSLTVYSSDFPATVPKDDRGPMGADLTVHATFPTRIEDVREQSTGESCEYVTAGRCFTAGSWCTRAAAFFTRSGAVYGFTQPEAFWLALEAEWAELAKPAYLERKDGHMRCPHCDGGGTVSR